MAFLFLFVWSPTPGLQVSLSQKLAIWWSPARVPVDAEKTFFSFILFESWALLKLKKKKKKFQKIKNTEHLVAIRTMLDNRVITVRISGKREKSPVTWWRLEALVDFTSEIPRKLRQSQMWVQAKKAECMWRSTTVKFIYIYECSSQVNFLYKVYEWTSGSCYQILSVINQWK